jgi:hypothetical protein
MAAFPHCPFGESYSLARCLRMRTKGDIVRHVILGACMVAGSMAYQHPLRRAHHCAGRGVSFSVSVKPETRKRDRICLEACIEGMAQKRFLGLAM